MFNNLRHLNGIKKKTRTIIKEFITVFFHTQTIRLGAHAAERVPDRASGHVRNTAFKKKFTPGQDCFVPLVTDIFLQLLL